MEDGLLAGDGLYLTRIGKYLFGHNVRNFIRRALNGIGRAEIISEVNRNEALCIKMGTDQAALTGPNNNLHKNIRAGR